MKQKTRAVCCGNIKMGAGAPISVQSMTNTYTGDVEKTVAQVKALEKAGCDIVRLAVNDAPAAAAVFVLGAGLLVIKFAGIFGRYIVRSAPVFCRWLVTRERHVKDKDRSKDKKKIKAFTKTLLWTTAGSFACTVLIWAVLMGGGMYNGGEVSSAVVEICKNIVLFFTV